jgi:hypothetical protein
MPKQLLHHLYLVGSHGDELVGWVARESCIHIREAADVNSVHGATRAGHTGLASGEVSRESELVAEPQQNSLLARNLAQPLADMVALAEYEGVVIEEKHTDDLRAVLSLFKLRQDHLAEVVTWPCGRKR